MIKGSNDTLIEGIDMFNRHMVVSERSNGLVNLKVVDLDSLKTHLIPFKEPTYVVQTTKYQYRVQKTSLFYTSLINPGSVYKYDLETNETSTLKVREVLGEYNESDYISKRLWVEVRDGTKVPVSLVHKKRYNS